MKKLPIIIGSSAMSLVVGIGLVVAFSPTPIRGEIDLPSVNTRIDNLEARTTNNESDIKGLQAATGTTAAEHVAVPAAPAPAVAVTPTQTTVALEPAPSSAPPETVAVVFVPYVTATLVPQSDGSTRLSCAYHRTSTSVGLTTMSPSFDVSLGCPAI